jgi:titin
MNGANGNTFGQNVIGTEGDMITPLANLYGIVIEQGASANFIGGVGVGNVIAANTHAGLAIVGNNSAGNTISQNAIFGNGELGIDLGNNGITPNSPGGPHTGPNDLQNYPVLTAGASPGTGSGSLNSVHNTTFTIEFFASPSNTPGQGKDFLGSIQVTTDAAGNSSFNYSFALPAGDSFVTATATDAAGNTSEFSAPV